MSAADSRFALRIRGLSVTSRAAGRHLPILRDVDLDLNAGEILGVVGESGSGKSTLCRASPGCSPAG
jgi:ABC-type glutathione transport system ATPase component